MLGLMYERGTDVPFCRRVICGSAPSLEGCQAYGDEVVEVAKIEWLRHIAEGPVPNRLDRHGEL